MRLYDRLFRVPFPGRAQSAWATRTPRRHRAPAPRERRRRRRRRRAREPSSATTSTTSTRDSKRVIRAYIEPALVAAARETRVQFERHGYFVADLVDHAPGAPVWNRAVTLKDSWGKPPAPAAGAATARAGT